MTGATALTYKFLLPSYIPYLFDIFLIFSTPKKHVVNIRMCFNQFAQQRALQDGKTWRVSRRLSVPRIFLKRLGCSPGERHGSHRELKDMGHGVSLRFEL